MDNKVAPKERRACEMAYFSSIFFKFYVLVWTLGTWQIARAQKVFSTHYMLSSL